MYKIKIVSISLIFIIALIFCSCSAFGFNASLDDIYDESSSDVSDSSEEGIIENSENNISENSSISSEAEDYKEEISENSSINEDIDVSENEIKSDSSVENSIEEDIGVIYPETDNKFESYRFNIKNDTDIYSGPGYDYRYLGQLNAGGTYTIYEEQIDDYGTVWGRIKDIGWIDIEFSSNDSYSNLYNDMYYDTSYAQDDYIYGLDDMILEGASRYYLEYELTDKTEYELSLLRNGLYALSGLIFESEDLQEYFESYYWYVPYTEDMEIVRNQFNEYQVANLELIVKVENEMY